VSTQAAYEASHFLWGIMPMKTKTVRACIASAKKAALIALLTALFLPIQSFAATYTVTNADQLTARLAAAKTGDVIVVRAGTYQPAQAVPNVKTLDGVLVVAPMFLIRNVANVTIRAEVASNKPVLKARGIGNGEYVFYAQNANNLIIQNLRIENGEKGLVVDRSNNVKVQGTDFREIGWEALHIRDGSKAASISGNTFQAIGVERNDRGEAVYIGSDKDKWHPAFYVRGDSFYQPACDDAIVEGNTFGPNIGGEAVDVKEGTTGVTVRNNTFNMGLTDPRLANSSSEKANSAIDVKGNGTVVTGNRFSVGGNTNITTAIEVFAVIKSSSTPNTGYKTWGYDGFFTKNTLSGDNASQFVAALLSYGGATMGCNTNAVGEPHSIGRKASPTSFIVSGTACNP
jgi:hypothetical protein